MNGRQELKAGAEALSIPLKEQQLDQLMAYAGLLQRWNKRFNLVSSQDLDDFVSRHLLDCLCVPADKLTGRILDMGTGAGLPGIPLAVAHPGQAFTLVDSNGKKVRFLQQVQIELGLENIHPVHSRIEALGGDFDTILARALSQLEQLWQWAAPLLAPGGQLLALKGQLNEEELAPVQPMCEEVLALKVPGLNAQRHLICLRKV